MDRKRKRPAPATNPSKTDSMEEDKTAMRQPPPSEEEVEEFFAILRRVHNSVKRSGETSPGNGARADLKVEVSSATPLVIDLNTVPDDEGESNGG